MTFERGFSLVDVMLAMAIVSLSAIGTLKLYSYIEVIRANSQLWIEAQQIVDAQIALMLHANTSNTSCNGNAVSFENVQSCYLTLSDQSPFLLKTKIDKKLTFSNSNGNIDYYGKIIKVNVSWKDRYGELQQLNMPVTVSKYTNLLN